MARDLHVSLPVIQLTLTSFIMGLGFGQLIIGPLSDRFGRRNPLLIGSAICVLASAASALAPNADVLIGARFVQGFAGAAGVVLGRAVIADLTTGVTTARYFSFMTMAGTIAPMIAPISGSLLLGAFGWRGILWAVTGAAFVTFIGVAVVVPESLPVENRHARGVRQLVVNLIDVASNRRFAALTLTLAFGFMMLFSWISASSFVLQNKLGLHHDAYAAAFAGNAATMLAANALNARLVRRVPLARLITIGVSANVLVGTLFAINVGLGTYLWPTIILSASMQGCIAFVTGNLAALAIGEARHSAGTASAIIGAAQFGLGSLVAPVVGVGGPLSAVPVATSMLTCASAAAGLFLLMQHRIRRRMLTTAA